VLRVLFGLQAVFELRAGLVAAQDVEFVGSASNAFFKCKRLERRFLCTCGCWQGITSGDHRITEVSDRKGRVIKFASVSAHIAVVGFLACKAC
jgi:hypothetical protein